MPNNPCVERVVPLAMAFFHTIDAAEDCANGREKEAFTEIREARAALRRARDAGVLERTDWSRIEDSLGALETRFAYTKLRPYYFSFDEVVEMAAGGIMEALVKDAARCGAAASACLARDVKAKALAGLEQRAEIARDNKDEAAAREEERAMDELEKLPEC